MRWFHLCRWSEYCYRPDPFELSLPGTGTGSLNHVKITYIDECYKVNRTRRNRPNVSTLSLNSLFVDQVESRLTVLYLLDIAKQISRLKHHVRNGITTRFDSFYVILVPGVGIDNQPNSSVLSHPRSANTIQGHMTPQNAKISVQWLFTELRGVGSPLAVGAVCGESLRLLCNKTPVDARLHAVLEINLSHLHAPPPSSLHGPPPHPLQAPPCRRRVVSFTS